MQVGGIFHRHFQLKLGQVGGPELLTAQLDAVDDRFHLKLVGLFPGAGVLLGRGHRDSKALELDFGRALALRHLQRFHPIQSLFQAAQQGLCRRTPAQSGYLWKIQTFGPVQPVLEQRR